MLVLFGILKVMQDFYRKPYHSFHERSFVEPALALQGAKAPVLRGVEEEEARQSLAALTWLYNMASAINWGSILWLSLQ